MQLIVNILPVSHGIFSHDCKRGLEYCDTSKQALKFTKNLQNHSSFYCFLGVSFVKCEPWPRGSMSKTVLRRKVGWDGEEGAAFEQRQHPLSEMGWFCFIRPVWLLVKPVQLWGSPATHSLAWKQPVNYRY